MNQQQINNLSLMQSEIESPWKDCFYFLIRIELIGLKDTKLPTGVAGVKNHCTVPTGFSGRWRIVLGDLKTVPGLAKAVSRWLFCLPQKLSRGFKNNN